jgi:hypothetical protein
VERRRGDLLRCSEASERNLFLICAATVSSVAASASIPWCRDA